MTDNTAIKKDSNGLEGNQQEKSEQKKPDMLGDVRAVRTEELRKKVSGLRSTGFGGIKISSGFDNENTAESSEDTPTSFDEGDEPVLVLNPVNVQADPVTMSWGFKALYAAGALLSIAWMVFCIGYAWNAGVGYAPHELGAFLAGMFAPPALFWLLLTTLNKRSDVHQYASALRSELQSLLFPSEETARVINKDIERLCRQAAEVSAASKAILKSLQRARQGLRVEIRDFSGVSKKAEFHIDRLADSLGDKTAKLLSLTEEIEQRVSGIDEKTQAGVEAWDEATLSVLDRAGEMEAAMDKGARKLLDAADQAGDRTKNIEDNLLNSYESLNEAVDKVAVRLEGLSTQFVGHTENLSSASDNVSSEAERLAGLIQGQIADLEDTTNRSVEAIAHSAEVIRDHNDALDRGAQSVADQSEKITQSISSSVDNLNLTIEAVISKTEGLESRIDEKATALHDVVKSITKESNLIEEAGEHAANKLGEALSVAVSGAENISSAVRRATESLEESTASAKAQADDLIEKTKQHIGELNSAGEGNVEHIREIVSLLEASRQQMQDVSEAAKTHVEELSEAVETQEEKVNFSTLNLTERMDMIRDALAAPLKDINAVIADVDGRHEMIEDVLRRRVSDLNEASEKATDSAENIRSILRGQVQEISALSGQISGNARSINEQMSLQKDTLAAQVEESLGRVEKVGEALDKQSKQLSLVSEGAVQDIVSLRGEISGRCQEISEFTGKAFAELVNIDESLDGKITLIRERADEAVESVKNIQECLEATAYDIEPVYIKAIERVDETHQRFEKLKSGYQSMTDSNLERLQKIGVIFDKRLQKLKTGSDEAASVLRSSSDHMQERVSDIETASRSAHEKMRDIASSFEDQSSDIHLITDQALLKVESIQKVINEQFHELAASVGQAIAQIKDAGDEFIQQSKFVQAESIKVSKGFDESGEVALKNSKQLNNAAKRSVDTTESLVSRVQKESETLLAKAEETLFELKKAGDAFSIRAREVSEQMKASLKTSASYGRELKIQAAGVADSSMESADRMSKAISIITSTMDQVGEAANDVTARIEKSREKLGVESDRLLSVSSAALEGAKDAALTFGKQSESLFKASQDAAQFTKEIQNIETRAQREAFLSSAKFIVESLYSLSVDIARMLEGDISEKAWKAFQKGDVSVFTRKLVALSESLPLDKARAKFSKDTEFRTYVQRFIRQFEEMYEQALENDHGALLSSTLGSSEVGKLYQFLCSVAGRESKLERASLKAA